MTLLANYLRHLREFLHPMGYCTHWVASFTGPAAASSELMKANTSEPLHYIDPPESGFYNLKDSTVIINLSSHLYIETSFAEWNLTRKWTLEACCSLYLHMDFTENLTSYLYSEAAAQGRQRPCWISLRISTYPHGPSYHADLSFDGKHRTFFCF